MSDELDLGQGFSARFFKWAPDRSIPANRERYKGVFDVERAGIILTCRHGAEGAVHFDSPSMAFAFPDSPRWKVESLEPLTISPSVKRGECGCHGYIRDGKWQDV